mgnify:CR=1 FL=1
MHMSTGRVWIIRLPIVFFMQHFTRMGREIIWIAMVLSNALIIVYSYYIYRTRDIIPRGEVNA